MKKQLIIFFLLLGTAFAYADEVTISSVTLNPGGSSAYAIVGLNGTRLYTSYNIDITLPEGWTVEFQNNKPRVTMIKTGGIYPSIFDPDEETYSYTHSVTSSYGEAGERVLRVACISTSNESFTNTTGNLFRIYLQALPYAKPGTPDISITNTDFGTYDSNTGQVTPYHFDDAVSNAVTVSTTSTLPLAISDALWSTCVLPFDAEIPSGVTAYVCDRIENDELYVTSVASFAAYTPYILHSDAAFLQNISGTVDPAGYPDTKGYVDDAAGILHGAIMPQAVSQGYILQKDPAADEPKFYDMNGVEFAIPSGKCWMTIPSGIGAPSIRLVIGAPTDSKSIEGEENMQIYNVLGMPVGRPLSGQVYIQNGKKFIQK